MDGTIETLEIIIRAKVDEAIKSIQTLTDSIKKEVNYSVNQVEKLSQKMEDIGKVKINVAKLTKDIDKVKDKIKEINNEEINPKINTYNIEEFRENIKGIVTSSESVKSKISSLGAEFSNAFKSIYDSHLGDSIKKGLEMGISGAKNIGKKAGKGLITGIKGSIKGISSILKNTFSKAGDNISNAMNRGLKSIKRFTLSLLSVRGAFQLISKVTSSYLSYDQQLNDSITNSWNVLGSLLAPALEYVVNIFARGVSYIAAFVKALTGIDLVAKANTKSMKNQAKATKEASKQLAGIDDINTLSSNSSSGGDSGVNPITTESIDMGLLDNVVKKVREIVDLIKNGNFEELAKLFSSSLISGLKNVSGFIKGLNVKELGENVSSFLENIDYSGIFTGIVEVFGEATLKFTEFMGKIKWEKIFKNLYKGFSDAIAKITEYLGQIDFSKIGEKYTEIITNIDWGTLASNILELIWSVLSQLGSLLSGIDFGAIAKKLSETFKTIIQKITELFQKTDWGKLGKTVIDKILDFIFNIDWVGIIKDLFNLLVVAIGSLVSLLVTAVGELISRVWNRVLEFFGVHSPSKLLQDFGNNIVAGLMNGLNGVKEKVVKLFTDVWNGIKNVFSKVGSFFKDTFTTAWEGVKKVFSTGGKIFDGIKEGIENVFKTIVNKLIKGINTIISVPFKNINKMLNKIKDVGIGDVKPFSKLWSTDPISIPKIPQLATGNVATEPTIAMFGEYSGARSNPEITAPQKTLESSFRKVLAEQNNTSDQHITVNVAGKNFFDEVINYINDKSERNGVSVIKEV